jgi:large subunit ribosomal protein L27
LGENVYIGRDFTVHATIPGRVMFKKGKNDKTIVYIQPFTEVAETVAKVKGAKVAKVAAAPRATVAKSTAKTAAPAAEVKAAAPVAASAAEVVVPAVVEAVAVAAPAVEAVSTTKAEDDDFSFDSIEAAFDEPATVAAPKAAAGSGKADDLKKIEGIGPKIAELFNNDGIFLFSELAATPVERMREILEAAGPRYRIHDPSTWAQQAGMAANGQWAELKELQDRLNGGKED